ncbi:hypothetical protein FRB96_003919 [Tulasnella sp. 330]|nr:hypothetical protein FRB96_003919 [Tulasnella sp. 330]
MFYRSYKTVHPDFFKVGTQEKIMSGEIENPGPSDLMSEKERQYYIDTFEASGLEGPTRYYKSTPKRYGQEQELHLNPVLPETLPILFVAPNHEPFTTQPRIEETRAYVPSQEVIRVEDSAHFVMLEKRDVLTKIIGDWVESKLKSTVPAA